MAKEKQAIIVKEKHGYEMHPTKLGKVWHFIAHEESASSFIVDAIIVILVGKFIILPVLGLALGTSFPLVAVVSGSMEHHGGFEDWWYANGAWYRDNQNITEGQFAQFSHPDGFNKGDVFIVRGVKISDIKVGDIIVYMIPEKSDPIIHRVIAKNGNVLSTKGDANPAQLSFESSVTEDQLKGVAEYKIPYIGWFKVILVDISNAISGR